MRSIEIDEDVYRFLVRNTRDFGETPSEVLRRLLDIPPGESGQAEARATDPTEASKPRPSPAPEEASAESPEDRPEQAQEAARAQDRRQGPPEEPDEKPTPAPEEPAAEPPERPAARAPEKALARFPEPKQPPAPAQISEAKAGDAGDREVLLAFLESPTILKANATTRYLEILGFLAQDRPDRFKTVLDMGGRTRKYFGKTKREIEESGKSTNPRSIPNSPYWAMTSTDSFQKRDILREAMERMKYDADSIRRCVTAVQ